MLGGMQGMAAEFQWGSEPAKPVAMLGSVATITVGAAFWPPVAFREQIGASLGNAKRPRSVVGNEAFLIAVCRKGNCCAIVLPGCGGAKGAQRGSFGKRGDASRNPQRRHQETPQRWLLLFAEERAVYASP